MAITEQEGLVAGKDYFVQTRGDHGGRNTFKRFKGMRGDQYVFEAINKVKYPEPIVLDGEFNAARAMRKIIDV